MARRTGTSAPFGGRGAWLLAALLALLAAPCPALAQGTVSVLPVQGLRSKAWDDFAAPGAPQMDFILTVCDNAAGEACPVWPGQPVTAHWGVPDPAAAEGSEDDKRRAFADAAAALRRRIELLVNLPMEKLDRLALQSRLREAGNK